MYLETNILQKGGKARPLNQGPCQVRNRIVSTSLPIYVDVFGFSLATLPANSRELSETSQLVGPYYLRLDLLSSVR